MPQRIKCPSGHSLIVSDDRAGRTLRCPRCGESVLVPGEGTVVAVAHEPPLVVPPQSLEIAPALAASAPAIMVAPPPKPLPPKPQPLKLQSPKQLQPPKPQRESRPAPPPVKPKSRVLPIAPPAPPPTIVVTPPPVSEPTTNDAADGGEKIPLSMDVPDIDRLQSLALPVTVTPPETAHPAVDPPIVIAAALEPLPAQSPSPEPAAPEPSRLVLSHESFDDIAAFLHLQFGDQASLAAPPRSASPVVRQPLDTDASRTLGVYQLAAALVAAALFSVAPALWDLVEYVRMDDLDAPFVARWALALFFLGIVQLAYAVYLFQLPDWATVWVVTMFQLLLAAGYAAVLGMVLISDGDGFLVGPHGLQLADKLAGGQAALWCLCMVSVATILAFFAGRMSVRWRQAERVMQSVQY